MEKITDAWVCSAGGSHEWQYLGGEFKLYWCVKCHGFIPKVELKAKTDNVEVKP